MDGYDRMVVRACAECYYEGTECCVNESAFGPPSQHTKAKSDNLVAGCLPNRKGFVIAWLIHT